MVYAQEQQRKYQDANRDPAPAYKVGDKVWLNMKNIKVHPSRKKKLSELHNQYEVKRVIGSYAYNVKDCVSSAPVRCILERPYGILNILPHLMILAVEDSRAT
jgi:hypothetical protein